MDDGGRSREKCVNMLAYLSELGLAISSQILITEAASKLVVSTDTTRHEDLLVLLRALGQSISQPTTSCRDQELPCSLRSGLEQNGCFDLGKVQVVECLPELEADLGTSQQSRAEGV